MSSEKADRLKPNENTARLHWEWLRHELVQSKKTRHYEAKTETNAYKIHCL